MPICFSRAISRSWRATTLDERASCWRREENSIIGASLGELLKRNGSDMLPVTKNRRHLVMNPHHLLGPLALATLTSVCFAQLISSTPTCAQVDKDTTYRTPPLTYPMTSDRYAVQYKLGAGNWTDVKVYISYYGGTNATPNRSSSNYAPDTSMSFASIPVSAGAAVALRVTKLWGSPFPAINH